MAGSNQSYPGTGGEDPAVIDGKRAEILRLKNELARDRQDFALAEQAYGEIQGQLIAALDAARAKFEADNAEIVARFNASKAIAELSDKQMREALIDFCKATGEKTFDKHLSVRAPDKLEYELADATKWAKENAPLILVADRKEFEKLAKDRDLDFVKKTPAYTAVIASALPVVDDEPAEPAKQGDGSCEAVIEGVSPGKWVVPIEGLSEQGAG